MKNIITASLVALLLGASWASMAQVNDDLPVRPTPIDDIKPNPIPDDPFGSDDPWPWGAECPFPWDSIEGLWVTNNEAGEQMFFSFKVLAEFSGGKKYVQVAIKTTDHEMIAEGRGVTDPESRLVRAVVNTGRKIRPASSYWAIIRTYRRDEGLCEAGNSITALTLRPFSEEGSTSTENDLNYELVKVAEVDSGSNPNDASKSGGSCRKSLKAK